MSDIHFLLGDSELLKKMCDGQAKSVDVIYSEQICDFLDDLAKLLRADKHMRQYPDVATFGFWCRRSHLKSLAEGMNDSVRRVGRGMVFHVAPSNVPVNFAFSLVFGLLAGNTNVVRVSEKDFPQIRIVCDRLGELLSRPEYLALRERMCVVQYDRDSCWNAYFSERCAARVIWGGDATIRHFQNYPLPVRAVQIHFADRYSLAVIGARKVLDASEAECRRLAHDFYNDTYLMDQNACSSPHLLCWHGELLADDALQQAKDKFYRALAKEAQAYDLEDIKCMDKFTMAAERVMQCEAVSSWQRYENLLYVLRLSSLPEDVEELRGRFGLFYEYTMASYREILGVLSEKVQTCTYYGIDPQDLQREIIEGGVPGVDRIVPVGKALDMTVIWDGMDVVESLSRIIDLQ